MARFLYSKRRATDTEVLKAKKWLRERVPGRIVKEGVKPEEDRDEVMKQVLSKIAKYYSRQFDRQFDERYLLTWESREINIEFVFPVAYIVDKYLSLERGPECELKQVACAAVELVLNDTHLGSAYHSKLYIGPYDLDEFYRFRRKMPEEVTTHFREWPLPSDYVQKICGSIPGSNVDTDRIQDQAFSTYFSYVAALDHNFSRTTPLKLAATCLYLSMVIGGSEWCREHVEASGGYRETSLQDGAVKLLHGCLRMMQEDDHPINVCRGFIREKWQTLGRLPELHGLQKKNLWRKLNRSERLNLLETLGGEEREQLTLVLAACEQEDLLESLCGSESLERLESEIRRVRDRQRGLNLPLKWGKAQLKSGFVECTNTLSSTLIRGVQESDRLERSAGLERRERLNRFKKLMDGLLESLQMLERDKLMQVERQLRRKMQERKKKGVVQTLGHTAPSR
ncbi:hypothetical protein VFPPC_16917 [Pochonia chlamydosporia 170]|uniref:Cyclin C-terminal domain-containing protein n=1 Tax=Pochonia chlamydosporia 170 TaxID=1380566 RepID=A0A179F1Q0_METCM|nr:hypothetical protein VFPPC_16917 [Pochonia chlamydosporia 170]OAQ59009.1 hypothetical protein VFPPC_16917 [Pochonia chlamydosporia 170]